MFSPPFRMSGTTILSAVYGYEVTSSSDPLVEIVETAVNHISQAAIPGNFYVNVIPWLRFVPEWFPGTKWKQTVNLWRAEKNEMVNAPFEWTRKHMEQGTAPPSVLKTLLSEVENRALPKCDLVEQLDRVKWTVGTLFGEFRLLAEDTTVAITLVFILAMTLYPDVQARAQAEIDRVVGRDRLPEMEDRDSLPYIGCVLKEVLRWQPVVPLGGPRASIKDDEYASYRIPKGATMAMSYDSSVYRNPQEFNPDRFLDPNTPSAPTFGFGRRSCPGVHMAESALFINMCNLLAVFNISAPCDDEGNPILPSVKMKTTAVISHPAEFECLIKPRSQKAVELLKA
ncbi:cytochrome P450 family protein [Ceratobasidium sp. AG-Ba]|nr:cytochrome P450 family protein [Ceratobasidium sp. AG-Ba]